MKVHSFGLVVLSFAALLAGFLAGDAFASKQFCDTTALTSCPSTWSCGANCGGAILCGPVNGGATLPACNTGSGGCTADPNCSGICGDAGKAPCSCPVAPADAC